MIALSPQTRVLVLTESIDFRAGIDSLIGLAKTRVREDPFSGALFVFRNKKATAIKAILYDGQGYWLFMKRLSEGKFLHWPQGEPPRVAQLLSRELAVLLWNGNPGLAAMKADWKKVASV
jgi:transposase